MVTNVVVVAAVPLKKTHLQDCFSKIIGEKKMKTGQNKKRKKDSAVPKRSYTRRQKLTPTEKLHLRRERNRITAQASRMKAKNEADHLKQRLFQLEYETMKLLLEHEALQKQSIELEVENKNLKLKTQSLCCGSMVKENSVEATFKHAWFVNVPLQKEWVFLSIFLTMIMSTWETLRQNAMTLNYLVYLNKQLNLNRNMKQKLSLACLPLTSMMCLPGYQYIPLIPGG